MAIVNRRPRKAPQRAPGGDSPPVRDRLIRCECRVQLDPKFPIVVTDEGRAPDGSPLTQFKPRFATPPTCIGPKGSPRNTCVIQRLKFEWTMSPFEMGAPGLTLSDAMVEECTVSGRGLYKLCVKVTVTCAAFAGRQTVRTTTCEASGCDEFQNL